MTASGPARRTAAITGIGVVAPAGIRVPAFWDLLTSGRTATRTISLFDATDFRSRTAAECDFEPTHHGLTAAEAESMDRVTQFAIVAAAEAVADSGLNLAAVPPEHIGAVLGSA